MRNSASFCGDASRGRGHPARTGTSVPGRDLYPLPGGTFRAYGDRNPVPDGVECPGRGGRRPLAQDVPGRGGGSPHAQDVPGVVECLRRRGTPLWAVPPQIEDVLFGRGLRSPTGSDDRAPVVWGEVRPGRRTQSPMGRVGRAAPSSRLVRAGHERVGPPCRYGGASPGGPGRPCGAVVGTDQGRSGTAATTSWWLPPPAAEPASTARTGRHDFPGASPPQGRVLAAHDGLACRSRGTPA